MNFALGSQSMQKLWRVYISWGCNVLSKGAKHHRQRARPEPFPPSISSNLHTMAIRFLKHATFIAAFAAFVAAQDDTIIPEDLRSGFRSGGDEVQVSFTGEAINGFKDGTVFEKDGESFSST